MGVDTDGYLPISANRIKIIFSVLEHFFNAASDASHNELVFKAFKIQNKPKKLTEKSACACRNKLVILSHAIVAIEKVSVKKPERHIDDHKALEAHFAHTTYTCRSNRKHSDNQKQGEKLEHQLRFYSVHEGEKWY